MCIPYLWLWGIGIIGVQIPILMLANNSGDEQVGLFSVGWYLVIPLTLLIRSALRAIFPILSGFSLKDPERFKRIVLNGTIFIVFIGTFAAFLLSIFSEYYIPLLFGIKYFPSVRVFNLLIWFGVIYALDILLGNALSASDKQNLLAVLATIDIIISIPILYYFSFAGAYGLAKAKLIIGFAILCYHWIIFKKILGTSFHSSTWIILIIYIVSIGSISIFGFIQQNFIKVILCLIITTVLYIIPNSPFKKIPILIKSNLRS